MIDPRQPGTRSLIALVAIILILSAINGGTAVWQIFEEPLPCVTR